jgi:hypothetical protein
MKQGEQTEEKRQWFQLDQTTRWINRCGLCKILKNGEWLTLKALMELEASLVGLPDWSEGTLWGWFRVRVSSELAELTGLSTRRQYEQLRSLEGQWNLIELDMGRGPHLTRVRFVEQTIKALGKYCIPRLKPYQGGIQGVTPLPSELHLWLRNDIPGFVMHWELRQIREMVKGVREDDKVDKAVVERILWSGGLSM